MLIVSFDDDVIGDLFCCCRLFIDGMGMGCVRLLSCLWFISFVVIYFVLLLMFVCKYFDIGMFLVVFKVV